MVDAFFAVNVKRVINAPPDRVFRAWTDPESLGRWFQATCMPRSTAFSESIPT